MVTKKIFVEDDELEEKKSPPKRQAKKVNTVEEETVSNVLDSPDGNLVDLPSKGVHGYATHISFRDMLVRDEEILSNATDKTFSFTMNKVLKGVLNNFPEYDKLTICDRDFLLVWVWANNYSPIKKFTVTCPKCGHHNNTQIDYTKVDTIDIHPKFTGEYEMELATNGQKIKVRLNTVSDEIMAESYVANNKDVSFSSVMLALSIDFGVNMPLDMRIKNTQDLITAREMAKIKKFHTLFKYGIPSDVSVKCSQCGEVSSAPFPFSPEDVFSPTISADIEDFL